MDKDVDDIGATELEIFIENDGDLYRQQGLPIIKNLVRKKAAGIYDSDKAQKLYMYLVENGKKKYEKDNYSELPMNKDTKLEVAKRLRNHFESEYNAGNYQEYVPKKYVIKVPTTMKSSLYKKRPQPVQVSNYTKDDGVKVDSYKRALPSK